MLLNPFRFGVPDTDPYWSNVSLLIHGTDGATPVDVSSYGHSLTISGVTPSTADGGYLDFLGSSSSRINIASSAAFGFGTGDYTLECDVYLDSGGGEDDLFDNRVVASPGVHYISADSQQMSLWDGSSVTGNVGTAITIATWHKVAWARSTTTLRAFVNGTVVWSSGYSGNFGTERPMCVGSNLAFTGNLNGRARNIRITKGVCRYTTNYTPRTGSFPTS